jgi:predicted MPP superfamily phosphohydrolase
MTAGQAYATHLRTLFALIPETTRFSGGRDQHRHITHTIRDVRNNLGRGNDSATDELTATGMIAALAWTMYINNEKAHATVIDHVNNLTPWDFCAFLGDLVDANPRTAAAQADHFAAMGERLEAAGPTVWLITSGEDYGSNNTEDVFLDETAARKAFATRALGFTVKEIQEETLGDVRVLRYRNGSDWIALEAHTATA